MQGLKKWLIFVLSLMRTALKSYKMEYARLEHVFELPNGQIIVKADCACETFHYTEEVWGFTRTVAECSRAVCSNPNGYVCVQLDFEAEFEELTFAQLDAILSQYLPNWQGEFEDKASPSE